MSSIVIKGNTSGQVEIAAPDVAGSTTLTLPTGTGTVITDTAPKTGSVLQVVQTVKTDTFSATTSTYVDVTGLSVSITPTNSSNKVLILVDLNWGASALDLNTCRLLRDSTVIGVGNAAGSRGTGFAAMRTASADNIVTNSISFLDSPSTTSATTYKIQIKSGGTPNTVYVNRTSNDTNSFAFARVVSSITVMEVAG